jgi:hypothetical protein
MLEIIWFCLILITNCMLEPKCMWMFLTNLCCLQWISVRCWIMLSATKEVFVVELCCLQRISIRCKIVLSIVNQVFPAELWCLQRISIGCRIVLPATNQCSLLNYSVYSEWAFAAELCCLQRNSFAVELCCLQRIRFSLPNCVVCSESIFVTELWCQ